MDVEAKPEESDKEYFCPECNVIVYEAELDGCNCPYCGGEIPEATEEQNERDRKV